MSGKLFNILQWNANGIGNKQTELSIFIEAHNVKVSTIQESKLTAKSRSPNIQNYTLVRHDRRQGQGGGLLFFIHNSVSFTRKSLSTTSKNDLHQEELTISIAIVWMVISGDDVCCSVVFGTLVGVFVFSVMWSELLMTSAISSSVVCL